MQRCRRCNDEFIPMPRPNLESNGGIIYYMHKYIGPYSTDTALLFTLLDIPFFIIHIFIYKCVPELYSIY